MGHGVRPLDGLLVVFAANQRQVQVCRLLLDLDQAFGDLGKELEDLVELLIDGLEILSHLRRLDKSVRAQPRQPNPRSRRLALDGLSSRQG